METKEKHVYRLTPVASTDKHTALLSMYNCLKMLKEATQADKREKIAITFLDYQDFETAKKVLEYVFTGTSIDVVLYKRPEKNIEKQAEINRTGKLRKQPNKQEEKESIVIHSEGRSYADLLREVKAKIDPEKVGVVVRGLRQTKKGDVLITLNKCKDTNVFKKEIEKEINGATVKSIGQIETTLHIIDIDLVTTLEDVQEAFGKQFKTSENEFQVKNIRPTSAGKQIASVVLNTIIAAEIIKVGEIKIGWLNCRIRERVAIQRCFKCLGYDHTSKECIGPDRENACFKCGEEGHKAVTCLNEEHCWVCNKKGHRSGSTKCPEYKKLLIKAQGSKRIN